MSGIGERGTPQEHSPEESKKRCGEIGQAHAQSDKTGGRGRKRLRTGSETENSALKE